MVKRPIRSMSLFMLLLFMVLHGVVAEAGSTSPEAGATEDVRALIESANADINRLIKKGDFDAAGLYFAEDAIQLVAGQPAVKSRAEWVAAQLGAAQMGEWDLQLEILELEVCGDMAVERGRGTQTFIANDQSPLPSFQMVGDYLVLWKKIEGKWQIQWDYVVTQPPSEQ